MEIEKMIEKLNEIEVSEEMQKCIIRNCYNKMEEKNMNKTTAKSFFRRPVAVAAALALCLCLIGATTLAATGKLDGFFKDIKRWDGAVTGTQYKQATDEIELSIVNVSDSIELEAIMLKPEAAPYGYIELLGIDSYEIVDVDGNVVADGKTEEMAQITDGKVNLSISLDNISSGEYRLVVSAFVGSSKAEQPLVMSGVWECDFTKQ